MIAQDYYLTAVILKIIFSVSVLFSFSSSSFAANQELDPRLEDALSFIVQELDNVSEVDRSNLFIRLIPRLQQMYNLNHSIELILNAMPYISKKLESIAESEEFFRSLPSGEHAERLQFLYGNQHEYLQQRTYCTCLLAELIRYNKSNDPNNVDFYPQILNFIYLWRHMLAFCQDSPETPSDDFGYIDPFIRLWTPVTFEDPRFKGREEQFSRLLNLPIPGMQHVERKDWNTIEGFLDLDAMPETLIKYAGMQINPERTIHPSVQSVISHVILSQRMTTIWPTPTGYMVYHASYKNAHTATREAGRLYLNLKAGLSEQESIELIAELVWMQQHGTQIKRGGGTVGEILTDALLRSMGINKRLKDWSDLWLEAILRTKDEFKLDFANFLQDQDSQ